MRRFARHWILVGGSCSTASLRFRMIEAIELRYVYLRIVGHHALIHAIESKLLSVWREERSLADAKLVTMNALSVYDIARSVFRQLPVFQSAGDIKIVVLKVGNGLTLVVQFKHLLTILKLTSAQQRMFLEVDGENLASRVYDNDALSCVWERGLIERVYLYVLGRCYPLVYLIYRKELCFLSRCLIYEETLFCILTHQLVSPPCAPTVLGNHVAIIGTAKVEILKSERFLSFLFWHYTHILSIGRYKCRH